MHKIYNFSENIFNFNNFQMMSKVFEILFFITLIHFGLILTDQDHQNHIKQSNQNRGLVYKLTYFNARLRAEFIRWILAGKYLV